MKSSIVIELPTGTFHCENFELETTTYLRHDGDANHFTVVPVAGSVVTFTETTGLSTSWRIPTPQPVDWVEVV